MMEIFLGKAVARECSTHRTVTGNWPSPGDLTVAED
jgi:hypothetical protein